MENFSSFKGALRKMFKSDFKKQDEALSNSAAQRYALTLWRQTPKRIQRTIPKPDGDNSEQQLREWKIKHFGECAPFPLQLPGCPDLLVVLLREDFKHHTELSHIEIDSIITRRWDGISKSAKDSLPHQESPDTFLSKLKKWKMQHVPNAADTVQPSAQQNRSKPSNTEKSPNNRKAKMISDPEDTPEESSPELSPSPDHPSTPGRTETIVGPNEMADVYEGLLSLSTDTNAADITNMKFRPAKVPRSFWNDEMETANGSDEEVEISVQIVMDNSGVHDSTQARQSGRTTTRTAIHGKEDESVVSPGSSISRRRSNDDMASTLPNDESPSTDLNSSHGEVQNGTTEQAAASYPEALAIMFEDDFKNQEDKLSMTYRRSLVTRLWKQTPTEIKLSIPKPQGKNAEQKLREWKVKHFGERTPIPLGCGSGCPDCLIPLMREDFDHYKDLSRKTATSLLVQRWAKVSKSAKGSLPREDDPNYFSELKKWKLQHIPNAADALEASQRKQSRPSSAEKNSNNNKKRKQAVIVDSNGGNDTKIRATAKNRPTDRRKHNPEPVDGVSDSHGEVQNGATEQAVAICPEALESMFVSDFKEHENKYNLTYRQKLVIRLWRQTPREIKLSIPKAEGEDAEQQLREWKIKHFGERTRIPVPCLSGCPDCLVPLLRDDFDQYTELPNKKITSIIVHQWAKVSKSAKASLPREDDPNYFSELKKWKLQHVPDAAAGLAVGPSSQQNRARLSSKEPCRTEHSLNTKLPSSGKRRKSGQKGNRHDSAQMLSENHLTDDSHRSKARNGDGKTAVPAFCPELLAKMFISDFRKQEKRLSAKYLDHLVVRVWTQTPKEIKLNIPEAEGENGEQQLREWKVKNFGECIWIPLSLPPGCPACLLPLLRQDFDQLPRKELGSILAQRWGKVSKSAKNRLPREDGPNYFSELKKWKLQHVPNAADGVTVAPSSPQNRSRLSNSERSSVASKDGASVRGLENPANESSPSPSRRLRMAHAELSKEVADNWCVQVSKKPQPKSQASQVDSVGEESSQRLEQEAQEFQTEHSTDPKLPSSGRRRKIDKKGNRRDSDGEVQNSTTKKAAANCPGALEKMFVSDFKEQENKYNATYRKRLAARVWSQTPNYVKLTIPKADGENGEQQLRDWKVKHFGDRTRIPLPYISGCPDCLVPLLRDDFDQYTELPNKKVTSIIFHRWAKVPKTAKDSLPLEEDPNYFSELKKWKLHHLPNAADTVEHSSQRKQSRPSTTEKSSSNNRKRKQAVISDSNGENDNPEPADNGVGEESSQRLEQEAQECQTEHNLDAELPSSGQRKKKKRRKKQRRKSGEKGNSTASKLPSDREVQNGTAEQVPASCPEALAIMIERDFLKQEDKLSVTYRKSLLERLWKQTPREIKLSIPKPHHGKDAEQKLQKWKLKHFGEKTRIPIACGAGCPDCLLPLLREDFDRRVGLTRKKITSLIFHRWSKVSKSARDSLPREDDPNYFSELKKWKLQHVPDAAASRLSNTEKNSNNKNKKRKQAMELDSDGENDPADGVGEESSQRKRRRLTKRHSTSTAEHDNDDEDEEVLSLRRELRQTISERDEEIQTLRAELNQTDDRTRMLKDRLSERDEEVKFLYEKLKTVEKTVRHRDRDIRELRKRVTDGESNFASLKASVDSLKQHLGVASVPTVAAGVSTTTIVEPASRPSKKPRPETNVALCVL